MAHSAGISKGFDTGRRKNTKEKVKDQNRENFLLRLSASLARALEGEFHLY
ncbi:MAG: hypothetical protein ACTSU8_04780 [Alphaproteobacteria bacterium]